MAEREGFEPSVEVSSHTRLAGERLQPTRPSLRVKFPVLSVEPVNRFSRTDWLTRLNGLAEGVGFEPTVPLGTTVFKTASLNHSDIPPARMCNVRFYHNSAWQNSQNFYNMTAVKAFASKERHNKPARLDRLFSFAITYEKN